MKRGIHYDLGPSLIPRKPSVLNMDTVPVTKNRCWRTESSRQRREEEEEARRTNPKMKPEIGIVTLNMRM
ncbi:hypothetical protein ACOMHN_003893 [Nucella lapillus]